MQHRRSEKKKRETANLRLQYQQTANKLHDAENALHEIQTMQVSNKNRKALYEQRIEELKTRIDILEKSMGKTDKREKDKCLRQSQIVKRFRYSLTHFQDDYVLNNEHWLQLREEVERLFPTFYHILNARTELNSNEYKVCLLVKSGFDPFEIEVLMDKKHTYASNIRKRLHKKIYGYEGSGAELDRKIRDL